MAEFGFEVYVPRTGKQIAGCIVCVIVDVVTECEFRTCDSSFGQLSLKHQRVLLQQSCTTAEKLVVHRPIVLLPKDAAGELCVKCTQGSFDAKAGIAFHTRNIPIGIHGFRRLKNRSS